MKRFIVQTMAIVFFLGCSSFPIAPTKIPSKDQVQFISGNTSMVEFVSFGTLKSSPVKNTENKKQRNRRILLGSLALGVIVVGFRIMSKRRNYYY